MKLFWFDGILLISGAEYNIMTKVIVSDFSAGESIYEKLELELADVPIGILGECISQP